MSENNNQTASPVIALMEYGATRYVAEEYLSLSLWDNEISDADNLSRFQTYLNELNVIK